MMAYLKHKHGEVLINQMISQIQQPSDQHIKKWTGNLAFNYQYS